MEHNAVSNSHQIERMNWEYWHLHSSKYKYFCSTKHLDPPVGKDLQLVRKNYGDCLRMPFPSQKIIYWAFKDPRGHKFFVRDFDARVIQRGKIPWIK